MILSIRVNNFLVYSNEIELSLKADMRIQKFKNNVYSNNGFNILKSVCLYGPNNSGKTCVVRAINSIQNVLLGRPAEVAFNLFGKDKTCSFGVSFVDSNSNKVYSYDFKFDSQIENGFRKGFKYECLKELISKDGKITEHTIFIRDVDNGVYHFEDNKELNKLLPSVSNNSILIYTINSNKFPQVEKYKKILIEFASKIDVVDTNNIPLEKTINALKNNEKIKEKTIELIKLADVDIEDYKYVSNVTWDIVNPYGEGVPSLRENVLINSIAYDDLFKLVSVHKGKEATSIMIDSTGTKKIVALASFIVDALMNGKTLVIDELDSSLHFKLTRAIVSLFNSELNKNAQLIFTAHDATLLDCKKLFRKDQIWFTAKDEDGEYLYSLSDFTAKDSQIRSDSNLFEKYNEGVFGAIPEPDLIYILLPNSNKSRRKDNE